MTDEALRGEIERYGWALELVPASDGAPSLGYTVGLTLRGLPEYAVRGLSPERTWTVLNDVAGRATAGCAPRVGETLTDVLAGVPLRVREMTDTAPLEGARCLVREGGVVRAVELLPVPDRVTAPAR